MSITSPSVYTPILKDIYRPNRYMSNEITVFVRTLTGSLVSVQIDQFDTIIELKKQLRRKGQGAIHTIQLKYRGEELEDYISLFQYKIKEGVTIDRITHLSELQYERVA